MLSAARGNSRTGRSAERRPRVARTSHPTRHEAASRAASVERRMRIAWALNRVGQDRRAVLALLLLERLTAAEAANALGMTVHRLRGFYRETLADLREAASGRLAPERTRRTRSTIERYRKAS